MSEQNNLRVVERITGGENEVLGTIDTANIPRSGDYIKYNGEEYRVQRVVHTEDVTELIVS